jgi:hypothetical protein
MQDISINAHEPVTLIIMFAPTAMQAYHDAIWGGQSDAQPGGAQPGARGQRGIMGDGTNDVPPMTVTWR